MAINYKKLPVYEQKQLILDQLAKNQVIVVQSTTGSGKTTQIPVILHEAGYSQNGVIAVTQPRRIAALSVSEFIAKQLKTKFKAGLSNLLVALPVFIKQKIASKLFSPQRTLHAPI